MKYTYSDIAMNNYLLLLFRKFLTLKNYMTAEFRKNGVHGPTVSEAKIIFQLICINIVYLSIV